MLRNSRRSVRKYWESLISVSLLPWICCLSGSRLTLIKEAASVRPHGECTLLQVGMDIFDSRLRSRWRRCGIRGTDANCSTEGRGCARATEPSRHQEEDTHDGTAQKGRRLATAGGRDSVSSSGLVLGVSLSSYTCATCVSVH